MKKAAYPVWANWLAKDASGECWVYEVEPNQFDRGWYENELGKCIKIACPGDISDIKWQNSLRKITQECEK